MNDMECVNMKEWKLRTEILDYLANFIKDEKDIKTKRMIVSLSSKIHNLSYYIESAEERQYRYDRQLEGAKCPY